MLAFAVRCVDVKVIDSFLSPPLLETSVIHIAIKMFIPQHTCFVPLTQSVHVFKRVRTQR